jgi:hypothetical protein
VFVPLFNYFEGGRSGEATPAPGRRTAGPEVLAHQ